eukprot:14531163-Alexandrium_andersonii.AAC.1
MLKSFQAFDPHNARAQKGHQSRPPKLLRGGFCAMLRADAESADETPTGSTTRILSCRDSDISPSSSS